MSLQSQPSTARPVNADATRSLAATLWRRAIPRLECGRLVIEIPSGERIVIGGEHPGPQARLAIHSARCLWRLVTGGDVGFAEAYAAGECSSPDIGAVLEIALRNGAAQFPVRHLPMPGFLSKLRHALNRNTRRGSRRNIAAHYDLGNDFYALWLDAGMNYSSALYLASDQSLEEAQDAKLDRVCALLDLSGGERVLEIGCGWGSLAERIIARYGCRLTGLTLSALQLDIARKRLADLGFGHHADMRLQDYRDVQGCFDRIVSIEMLEAVGEAYWPTYFAKLASSLRPGGIAVLQAITIDESVFPRYRRQPDFIQKYIFPGGMLPTRNIIETQAAAAGLRLVTAEFFGRSYARTLAEWQRRFQSAWPAIAKLGFDDRFKRIWEYYLCYCQAGFEAGIIDVGRYKFDKLPKPMMELATGHARVSGHGTAVPAWYASPMLQNLAAHMRRSDIHYPLLIPLLVNAAAVQAVIAIARVTTSYRVVELGLPVVWLGIIAAAYALLPAFMALWLGRFIDRGHDALATWIGAALTVVACLGLLISGASQSLLLATTALLGVGNLFSIVSQQLLCVRTSRMHSRESVFGNYMVACAVGQAIGPLIVGWAGGNATVPPTQLLFGIGLGTAVIGLVSAFAIRPARHRGVKRGSHEVTPVRELLRLPGLWPVMLASVISVTAADLIVIYLPLLGAERSIDVDAIGGLLTARAAASMLSRLLYARLIVTAGRTPLMVMSLLGAAAAFAVLAIPSPMFMLYAATASAGFGIGIATTITVTAVVAMTSAGSRGTANSLRVTGNRIAQVAMPFGASLVAAVAGAGGIFVIIAGFLAASGAAVYWRRGAR